MKFIHLKRHNMKCTLYGIMILLFGIIVYRIIVISRLLPNIMHEGMVAIPTKPVNDKPVNDKPSTVSGTDNSSDKINNMIDETGKKIKIVEKNGSGQKDKLASMNTKIDFINKELDKKLKPE